MDNGKKDGVEFLWETMNRLGVLRNWLSMVPFPLAWSLHSI